MAASDPTERPGGGPGQPMAPQGQPVPEGQHYPRAQPVTQGQQYPQSQAIPQGQPYPQAQPAPQPHPQPIPQGQPVTPGVQPAGGVQPRPVAAQPAGARPVPIKGAATTQVYQREDEPAEEEDLAAIALENAPPWLVSAVFHMVLLIVLGLWMMADLAEKQVDLVAEIYAEDLGEQLEFDSPLAGNDEEMVEEPVITPDNLPEVDDPFAAPTEMEITLNGTTALSDIEAPQIGLALSGRQVGMKKSLLAAYGGTARTEAAVQLGLQWLAKNQRKDGSWSLVGPYRDGANDENPVAATAMALLAFQGNGNTHLSGKYKSNVTRGWKWLLGQQDADGNFYHEGPFNHRFYTQGQCTIAACELYGMTKDEKCRPPAESAVQCCLKGQSSEGGWRYYPQGDSDLSVTGWIVMALQSAKMAELEVPQDHFRRVERFLDKVSKNGGSRYAYQRGREPNLAMTAEGLLCRQYLGWARDDERLVDGVKHITQEGNLVSFEFKRNAYYWYYATQAAHHMEGEYWKKWNAVMRQVVPENQVTSGREAGSWHPHKPSMDQWADHGGRLMVTCLSIYMLEVYYRHLPIYSKVYTYVNKP